MVARKLPRSVLKNMDSYVLEKFEFAFLILWTKRAGVASSITSAPAQSTAVWCELVGKNQNAQ